MGLHYCEPLHTTYKSWWVDYHPSLEVKIPLVKLSASIRKRLWTLCMLKNLK